MNINEAYSFIKANFDERIPLRKEIAVVNNSTTINKTNIHLSPQIIQHQKITCHRTLTIVVVGCDKHKDVAELKRSMG